MWPGLIYVFVGGGLGSVARYAIGVGFEKHNTATLPYHTLLSNFISCLIAGLLIGYLPKSGFYTEGRLWLLTGFCGGFSTFSTFSLEVVFMIQKGAYPSALFYATLSFLSCLIAVFAGIKMAS
ncbi:MAG: fluoride efflux transporter CrcB [Saprospiraceae bacterium]|nr:fluoride efflux transporter CrcB [Saprospiraceae bacterium]